MKHTQTDRKMKSSQNKKDKRNKISKLLSAKKNVSGLLNSQYQYLRHTKHDNPFWTSIG